MAAETPENENRDDLVNELAEPTSADAAQTAEDASQPEMDQLTVAEAERDRFRDQYLRAAAEMENIRKRSAREREELLKYASLGLMSDLLPAVDNLQRAIEAGAGEDQSGNLLQGVQMVLKQFEEILARHGAEPIHAQGEPFDPNVHEALQQVPKSDVPPMTVVQELERGFKLRDRVLRPSKVIVSSQPAKET